MTGSEHFGTLADGTKVERWWLANGGVRLGLLSYGGIVQTLEVPDRHGLTANISLGYDTIEDYTTRSPYFGALIGRYGNRIAGGRFTLDGESYRLPVNNGPNSLHGGDQGFDRRIWSVEPFAAGSDVGLVLRRTSTDGEMGYPGTLEVEVVHTLTAEGGFRLDYRAVTDRPTVVNLTNHTYFNLRGRGGGSVHAHLAELAATRYTPVDAGLIPTGELAPVADTPFDFRAARPLGGHLGEPACDAHPQIRYARGIDHNFVLDKGVTAAPEHAATVTEPVSGRVLRISTTEPGVQFYTGNFLTDGSAGTYRDGDGFCLETQHFPDSPNQPSFPSTVLRPGRTYRSTTVHSFNVR